MLEAQKLHASLLKAGLQNHVYRYNLLLRAFAKSGSLSFARDLLLLIPHPNLVSYNTLLSGFVRFHQIDDALQFFNTMPQTDARSWNTIISGLLQTQQPREAIAHFVRMIRSSPIRPDNFTYATIVACSDLGTGRQLHAQIVKVCSNSDAFIGTNLVRMYAEAGEMGDARKLFEGMPERDLVSWNVMVSCYSKFGMGEFSVQLFQQMVRDGMRLDEFTLAIVLNEFARRSQVFEGMQVHALIIRSGFCSDRFTCNALLNLYSQWGFIASAVKLFHEMPERDVVSWTAMITGFAVSGNEKEAFEAFHWMRISAVEPNSFSFGSLISSCANANAYERGKQYHGLVMKFGLEVDVVVGSAIVDMYSKCGEMKDALRLFQSLPDRDLVSWNGMICGLAQNGEVTMSLKLFDEMVRLRETGVTPNHVTFVGVLSACSHGGLVHEGCHYFGDMVHEYSIKPQAEHFACMVDILARSGLLEEAETIILALPFEPDVVMWGSLLGACRRHGNLVAAKRIANRLFVDEPKNSSSYVLLANMYSATGEWHDAFEVRDMMSSVGAQKVMGSSWIEIRGHVHSFTAGHTHHPQIKLISEVLQRLWLLMFEEGYECDLLFSNTYVE